MKVTVLAKINNFCAKWNCVRRNRSSWGIPVLTNFCPCQNGYCGKTTHEYGKSHRSNEISLVIGFQKASKIWKLLIRYPRTTIMYSYKCLSFEFSAKVLIILKNFSSLNKVFGRFWCNKNPKYHEFGDPKCFLSKNILKDFWPQVNHLSGWFWQF